jgi:hypothetical protein
VVYFGYGDHQFVWQRPEFWNRTITHCAAKNIDQADVRIEFQPGVNDGFVRAMAKARYIQHTVTGTATNQAQFEKLRGLICAFRQQIRSLARLARFPEMGRAGAVY